MDERAKVKKWAELLSAVRAFFDTRGFVEVSTACLVPAGAFESSIDVLQVSHSKGHEELHSSPEIEMKGVLSRTHLPIYQICKAFRDDPPTGVHKREFTMLEFYRPDCDYRATQQDIKELLPALAGRVLPFEEITVRDLILRSCGIDLARATTAPDLRRAIESRSLLALAADDDWDDMYFKLLLEKGEPSLDPARPTLVRDYPASQAALAKVSPTTGLAERFEIYWQTMELCNGCTELDDLGELKRRYEHESHARQNRGKAPHPYPTRLFEAMGGDFPKAAGVAVGLDRVFKCMTGEF